MELKGKTLKEARDIFDTLAKEHGEDTQIARVQDIPEPTVELRVGIDETLHEECNRHHIDEDCMHNWWVEFLPITKTLVISCTSCGFSTNDDALRDAIYDTFGYYSVDQLVSSKA